nr:immunoglobulin heavy chain junction region [Mus musculus]
CAREDYGSTYNYW